MAETARKISASLEQMHDGDVKNHNLERRIRYILRKVQAFAEIGQEGIESNWANETPIIPLCRAIRNNLAELEELVLNYQSKASPDFPEEKIRVG